VDATRLNYAQMERMLDSTTETIQFDGYVAHWSSATDSQILSDCALPKVNSCLSQNAVQPGEVTKNESGTTQALSVDLDDPLEMSALFRQLYKASYSIIDPQKG